MGAQAGGSTGERRVTVAIFPHPKPTRKPKAPFDHDEWRKRGAARYAETSERKPVNPVNRERRAERHEESFGEYADEIRKLDCVVPGCPEPSIAAHFKSRGAGGKRQSLFPACIAHHDEQHALGITTWQQKHGLDLEAITAHLWRTREW